MTGGAAAITPGVPTFALSTRTRAAEARAAMAVVAGLVDRGVSPSDVTVVVRDLDPYEEPLSRAADRYGVRPNFWIQLRLKRTLPYRLLVAVLDLLVARESGTVPADALLDPLRFEWVPPVERGGTGWTTGPGDSDPDAGWPLPAATVAALARSVDGERRGIDAWRDRVAAVSDAGARLGTYLDWLDGLPARPDPDDVPVAVVPLLDAYRERVLPARRAADDATYSETARTARALARLHDGDEGLVPELASKYGSWLDADYGERSWATVRDLCDALATTVPGRREYPAARSVDVMEANDVWGLDLPYVVAGGLVDGEWPRPPESAFPAPFRERLRGADGAARNVRPRSGWTEGREFDQFADAVAAASEALVVTRHEYDADGVERRPSPYLRALDPTPVDRPAVGELIADCRLPPRLAATAEGASR
ncbi:hypothetical protein G9464_12940 [Halostella sp. JP-L12]|uniref:hypothetical protein n=1 Tax=Halostella TaxID=1843185 RepID=UPI000EF82D75|nr:MULTISPECIES: hypothetical protein [Halostella]NHN48492.1 hypothetical protein [Halostella sp. JP-L12]